METHGASKSQIIFKANLNHKLAEKYTSFLVKKGFLRVETNGKGARYFLTERGEHLLQLLREVEKELSEFYSISLATELKARSPALHSHPIFDNERDRVPIEIQRASTF